MWGSTCKRRRGRQTGALRAAQGRVSVKSIPPEARQHLPGRRGKCTLALRRKVGRGHEDHFCRPSSPAFDTCCFFRTPARCRLPTRRSTARVWRRRDLPSTFTTRSASSHLFVGNRGVDWLRAAQIHSEPGLSSISTLIVGVEACVLIVSPASPPSRLFAGALTGSSDHRIRLSSFRMPMRCVISYP